MRHNVTELKEVEKLYRTLANSSPVGVYIVQDGKFRFVNPQFQKYTGFSEDELLDKESLGIVHPEDRERVRKNAVDMLKGNRLSPYELRYIVKGEEILWATETVTSIQYRGKRAVLGNFMDITERKQVEEELHQAKEKFQALVEESPLGVSMLRKDGHYQYVNPKFVEMFGYTLEDFPTGREWFTKAFPDPEYRSQVISTWVTNAKSSKRGEVGSQVFTVTCKDGSEKIVQFRPVALETGDYFVIYEDITGRKRAEEALKQKMEELRVAYQKLQELDQMKDSFLSTVSHELRTPLTSIKSFSEILLNYDEDKETQKEFLNIIREESDRLTRLINDFLDLSKIEAGRMQWETVELSLSEVIQTAVNATQALAAKTNLSVDVEVSPDLPTITCDKDRLVQVVTNLLSNAIKFTPEGGMIQVKAQTLNGSKPKRASDMVMVSVSDTGIGIAPKDYKSVFEKFKQVGDTLTDKPKGTGLGLPICKEIVEHYGGRIWVESELGKGSTFFFALPIMPKTEAKVPKAEKEEAKVIIERGKTILVVDNEAHIRRFLGHELTKKGYHVLEASGGKEAIDLARKSHPDLITLDVMMPDLSGFDVTAVLKNDPGTKDIPILIVSVTEDKEKAYKLGANDYVTKPFKIEILIDKVNQLLRDAQKKILVVDDDKNLVKSIKYQLRKRGFATYVAYDGKRALEKVESQPPDLILLDIIMPEIDGYEVMKELKRKPGTADIPIVVMTGVDIDGGRVRALSVGATEYLTKSGGFDKMFETIESILYSQSGV